MQSIQENVLGSRISLGINPILIVSEQFSERTFLSLLISNHLLPIGATSNLDRKLTLYDNYFITPYLNHVICSEWDHISDKDLKEILELHLNEGFDTQRLYGLCLNTETFLKLANSNIVKNSFVIYIHSDLVNNLDAKSKVDRIALYKVLELHKKIRFVNAKLLFTAPLFLLKKLINQLNASIYNSELIKCLQFVPDNYSIGNTTSITNTSLNILSNEKKVSTHFILIINESISEVQVNNYLTFLYLNTNEKLNCTLLFNSTQNSEIKITKIFYSLFEIKALNYGDNLAEQLYEIISTQVEEWVVVDNLNLMPNPSLLDAISTENYSVVFSTLGFNFVSRVIYLNDLFSSTIVEFNLAFRKNDFLNINGLDNKVTDIFVLWDLAIRLSQTNLKPILITSSALAIPINVDSNLENNPNVTYILKKHKQLLNNSVEETNQHDLLSIKDLKLLSKRVNNLDLLLSHSKEELSSMQSLNAQLQHRVRQLENSWYQKTIYKIVRIKRIFFKKKTPGTGILKRILQTFRFLLSKSGFGILRKISASIFKHIYLLVESRPVTITYEGESTRDGISNYHNWILNKLNSDKLDAEFNTELPFFSNRPLISIVMPVYNPPLRFLKEAIDSVMAQNYSNWQLCIADDFSPNSKVKRLIKAYAAKDKRIEVTFRKSNGHISTTSNDALQLAKGEYILFMDHDDLITQNCLWEVVKTITKTNPDIIYSDEDKIDESNFHQSAYFKPQWSPDHLMAKNYIGHVCVIKKSIIDSIKGFRVGFEGSQDYDLLLRATELTQNIAHIPKVLYHWRIHSLSAAAGEDVKPYAYIAAKRALEEALIRRGMLGKVRYLSGLRGYRIDYEVRSPKKVSIIIPTKDQSELLKNAVDSILTNTSYAEFEIIILNNNSSTLELKLLLEHYTNRHPDKLRVLEAHFPFNFSKLMNIGVKAATGNYILFLNNDVEIINKNWLTQLVSYAEQPHIGAVGAKLLYPDDTIQHAGVIVGLGGIAGHAFVGQYKDDPGYFNLIQSVNNFSAVTAACLLCRKEVFEKVNGMDEQFEVEYNDVDFCLKLIEAGYYNVYLPQVELYHYESATRGHPHQSKSSYERHLKEMQLFKAKWQHVIDDDPFYNPNLHLGVHDFIMDLNA